jgi:hypothetical protein
VCAVCTRASSFLCCLLSIVQFAARGRYNNERKTKYLYVLQNSMELGAPEDEARNQSSFLRSFAPARWAVLRARWPGLKK